MGHTLFLIFIFCSVLNFNLFAEEVQSGLVYLKVEFAVASSFDDTPDWAPPKDPMAPVDGNFDTRWSPLNGRDNEWIYFDFGRPKTISKIVIHWERAYAVDYEILVCDNLTEWKSAALLKGQGGGIDEIDLPQTAARYVKLVGLKRSNPDWGFSMWEFEMYGPKELNPDDKPIEEVFPERKVKEAIKLVLEEPLPSPGKITKSEFHKGMSYSSYHENELAAKESDAILEYLKAKNIKHISLLVNWYQDTLESDKMYPESPQGGRTPVDEALSHAINKIHSLGIKVMLKPHIDVQTGEFRGDILGSEEWFKNYNEFILRYAKFASKYNVEMFCIGTELSSTTYSRWGKEWKQIIKNIRKVYKGPLVYAANWDEYKDVSFWDELDFVGVDAYFPLTSKNNPSKDELIAGWTKWANEIENWLKEKNIKKSVIFTEIGYASADGVNKRPWEIPSQIEDQAEQADCLDAALTVLTKRDWFKGMYWWNTFPKEIESPLSFTMKGKKAEPILANWYKKLK